MKRVMKIDKELQLRQRMRQQLQEAQLEVDISQQPEVFTLIDKGHVVLFPQEIGGGS